MIFEVEKYIRTWEGRCYKNGIPDEVPKEIFDKAPSYKAIAIAILKNDISILGFERPKSKWYSVLKKIEIESRKDYRPKETKQLSLFGDL